MFCITWESFASELTAKTVDIGSFAIVASVHLYTLFGFRAALPGPEATLKQLNGKVKHQAVIRLYSKLEINTT
jgi:hypothetical protein